MNNQFKICWICATISGLWLVMSVMVAWGVVSFEALGLPIALLMGGSVVGIANKLQTLKRKIVTIAIGMPVSFILITNLTKITVLIELILLLIIAYKLFVSQNNKVSQEQIDKLAEQMKQCC